MYWDQFYLNKGDDQNGKQENVDQIDNFPEPIGILKPDKLKANTREF